MWSRDPESYLVGFHDGPPQERTFGSLAGLACYWHPFSTLEVMWIGDESDIGHAFEELQDDSGDLTDWARVTPEYDHWLREHT